MSNTVVLLGLIAEAGTRIVNDIAYWIDSNSNLTIVSTINPATQSDVISYAVKYLF